MKKIIMILILVAIGLTACKKEDIKPNVEPYIENIVGDTIEDYIEGAIVLPSESISDSMTFVSINIFPKGVSMGININSDGIDYPVYGNSVDSSIYVSGSTYYSNNSLNWNGWIKPSSRVTVSGSYTGFGNTNVFSFKVNVLMNGNNYNEWFDINGFNKDYSMVFYVE